MTRQEQLAFCKICHNKQMSSEGLICSLTNKKADFELSCKDFDLNEKEQAKRARRELELENTEEGFFSEEQKGIKSGVLGGLVMILISVVWFFGGLAADIIFYYPPILFCIGVFALIKGAIEGNISGEKHKKQKYHSE